MKAFLRRVLGVDALSAQVGVLNQRVRELKSENERLELEVSMCKAKALDLNTTQAGKLHAIVKEARNASKKMMAVA
ncbi:MAG: hypothetical protein PHE60_07615 [Sulfurospirillaceae bacterium]|nr:hypothetical protein [Sulfurospirillaceae bacterium]